MSLEDNNILAISISVARNVKGSSILNVDNSTVVILEELEPSSVSGPDLKI
jgi:hypothetical protein